MNTSIKTALTTFSLLLLVSVAAVRGQTAGEATSKPAAAAPSSADGPRLEYATVETSLGKFVLELNRGKAPISVDNFLAYVDSEFYDGTIFHRVISNFMIQGGGFTPQMKLKPTEKPIKNEWQNGLKNVRGSIAMARLGGRHDSATSQFFVNVRDNAFLDTGTDGAGYAVFGKVVVGMAVVDRIRNTPVTSSPQGERSLPKEQILIEKIRRLPSEEADKIMKGEKEKAGDDSSG